MSCCIAIKDKTGFIMLSDSRSSTDTLYHNNISDEDSKMFRVFDDRKAIISHVGASHDIAIIKTIPRLTNDFDEDHEVFDYDYIIDILNPKIKEEYKRIDIRKNTNNIKNPTSLLVAKDDKCYVIDSAGYVNEIADFYVLGSGYYGALAAYKSHPEIKDPLTRGLIAIKAACYADTGVGFPIHVARTTNEETLILNEDEVNEIINKGVKDNA